MICYDVRSLTVSLCVVTRLWGASYRLFEWYNYNKTNAIQSPPRVLRTPVDWYLVTRTCSNRCFSKSLLCPRGISTVVLNSCVCWGTLDEGTTMWQPSHLYVVVQHIRLLAWSLGPWALSGPLYLVPTRAAGVSTCQPYSPSHVQVRGAEFSHPRSVGPWERKSSSSQKKGFANRGPSQKLSFSLEQYQEPDCEVLDTSRSTCLLLATFRRSSRLLDWFCVVSWCCHHQLVLRMSR